MTKLTNDEKIRNVKLRKILKYIIMLLALLTIIFSVLSLWKNITPIFAIIFFIIEVIVSKYREKLDPRENKKEK